MSESEKPYIPVEVESQPSFEVAEATPEDAESIAHIQYQGRLDTFPDEAAGVSKEDVQQLLGDIQDQVAAWRERLNEHPENVRTLVIKKGDQVVGFCKVSKWDDENFVGSLFIAPGNRGQKIGATVFTDALTWLGDDKPVALGVVSHNKEARAFYNNFGFAEAEAGEPKVLADGREIPVTIMRRPAASSPEAKK